MNAKVKPFRDRYRVDFRICQLCEKRLARHVHEIASAAAREKSLEDRAAWLSLCISCHVSIHDHSQFPVSKQCALKAVADPEGFDLDAINRLRGRSINAITWADVAQHLELKQ